MGTMEGAVPSRERKREMIKFELNGKTYGIQQAGVNFLNNCPDHDGYVGGDKVVYQLKADGDINWSKGDITFKRDPEVINEARRIAG
jgi:hypothetical protein